MERTRYGMRMTKNYFNKLITTIYFTNNQKQ